MSDPYLTLNNDLVFARRPGPDGGHVEVFKDGQSVLTFTVEQVKDLYTFSAYFTFK